MTITLTPLRLESETVAIVATRHLSWHRVQCPPGVLPAATAADPMGARLRSVLAGLLEDRLLDEPDSLHFALQPPPYATDGVWVAVCDRSALAQALQQLTTQGDLVHRLVPECAPTPQDGSPLWITGSTDAPHALWADAQGVHQWPLPAHTHHANAWPAPVQERLAQDGAVQAEPAVAAWAERVLDASVQVQPVSQRLEEAALANRWNLAQGSLSLHKPWTLRLQQGLAQLWSAPAWRPARWMAAALLLVQLAGLNTAAWQARRQENALQAAINASLLRAFPQTQAVVDAPAQMQRGVAALTQGSGSPSVQDLDVMLQFLQQNMSVARTEPAITAINFEASILRLDGLQMPSEQATALAQALRSHKLALRQEGNQWLLSAEGIR